VKLVDTNLPIYAADETSARQASARNWFESALSGSETVAFAWVVLLGFVRITTRATAFTNPMTPDEALDVVDGWLAQPAATVVHPTARHPQVLRELLEESGTAGNLTTDAHLAAIAIEHGATLYSCDHDFSRFPGLQWVDPLRG
jgi:toxin-antitoxin system PIN domain toxin